MTERLRRWLLLATACLPLLALARTAPLQDAAWHVEAADRAITAREDTATAAAAASQPRPGTLSDGPPALDDRRWAPATLPDTRRAALVVPLGEPQRRMMAWYRLRLPAHARGGTPAGTDRWALYLPRVTTPALELWWHDGAQWRALTPSPVAVQERWSRPVLLAWPEAAPPAEAVRLVALGLPLREATPYAVSSAWIGPEAALRLRAELRLSLQKTLPQAMSVAMAALGLLALGVWLRRRRERAYLYFGMACLAWPLRNLEHWADLPGDPATAAWLWWLANTSISWVMLATYWFVFHFDSRRHPAVERGLLALVTLGAVLGLPLWPFSALLLQHAINALTSLCVTGLLTARAVRGGRPELRVIVAALWACLGFGVHDWLLISMTVSPESILLLPYGSALLIGSFLFMGWRRFIGAIEHAEAVNATLESQLAEREAALAAQHERLRQIERQQAVLLERQRLMRDMHDGVGAALISALRVVEQGSPSASGVAEVLRAAVDDLRIAIDSLEPIEHDLATLLAGLRARMGRRLEGAGLTLHWSMADLPPLPWLDAPQALQVLRLLQEALANAIRHAQARNVRIAADTDPQGRRVFVEVADDGTGFQPDRSGSGRGLANMRQRAASLQGQLKIESAAARGTVVRLWLPVELPAS